MKIKQVKISAFRAFNNVEDATFDFMLPDNEIAKFISIYAPNGYGKTSFYDAIEWSITGQIERFHKNCSEYEKSGKENRRNNSNPFFLQHNNQKDFFGSVEVITDKKTFKKDLTKSRVYNFKKKAHNVYFKDVILSQDLVDTFIKEDKAEERYTKFIESIPHLNDYNKALLNIIKLIANTNDDKKRLDKEIKNKTEVQLSIDSEGDEKIIEEINNAILNLIEKEQKLLIIQKDCFSKKELDILTQKVNSGILLFEDKIKTSTSRINGIDVAYSGLANDPSKIGIVGYFNLKQKSDTLFTKKSEIIKLLDFIKNKETLGKQKLDLENEINSVIELNKSHLKMKLGFDNYSKKELEIQRLNKNLTDLTTNNENLKQTSQELLSKETDTKNSLIKKKKELETKQQKLKEFPLKKIKLEDSIVKINKLTVETKQSLVLVDEETARISEIDQKLKHYTYLKNKLKDDIDLLLDDVLFKDHKTIIKEIIESKKNQNEFTNKLQKINGEISLQDVLNNELKDFLSRGLELVTKNESTNCPLCSQHYDSYRELSDKISNNELLGQLLQTSLAEKSKIEIKIKRNNLKIIKKIDFLGDILKNTIKPYEQEKLTINKKNKERNDNLNIYKENVLVVEREKNSLKTFFEGLTYSAFEGKIKTDILELETIIIQLNKSLEEVKTQTEDRTIQIRILEDKIKLVSKEIETVTSDRLYKDVIAYFNDILKSTNIDLDLLEYEIRKNSNNIETLKVKIEKNSALIKKVDISLINNELSEKDVLLKIDCLTEEHLSNRKIIENFEQFVSSEYKIALKELKKNEADARFEKLKSIEKKNLEYNIEILRNYKIAEKLKNNTYNLLESEKTKIAIEELKEKINENIEIVSKLNDEKNKLELFLKKSVDGFFYTELINKLYQKIEPHPEYEKIEFDCDFKDNNPRLQIFTVNKDGEKSIPALYFSTAQINILSLSIFLARALKATNPRTGEPVKCIFIDDPIQSMDSINILSFIDLFRSIVVNLDRQLIVSTHEENFHLLLQKKIPESFFKSKFIKFETFGKLENN